MKYIYRGKGKDVKQFSEHERRFHKLSTSSTIVEICGDDALMDEMYDYCRVKRITGFDTETTGLNFFRHRIVLAQVGDLERQYLIWLDRTNPDRLLQLLRDDEIVKIGLNLKFDLDFMLYQYGKDARAWNVVDTILTAQVLCCGFYESVGFTNKMTGMESQAQHWLGLDIPKDPELRTGWGDGWDPVSFQERIREIEKLGDFNASAYLKQKRQDKILYAADDVNLPILLAHEHKPWIKELGLVSIVNLENEFLPVLVDTEVRGMPFDKEQWIEIAKTSEAEVKKARRQLDDMFEVKVTISIDENGKATYERDKNYNSPYVLVDLMKDWMWENCGVDLIANNKHFKQCLEKYGSLSPNVIERLFKQGLEPDPDDPTKKKKVGYPTMTDVLEQMWDLYRHHLPADAFILPNTDSKTLKFFKTIYEAPYELLHEDREILPTMFGLPPALVDPILNLRGYGKAVSSYGTNWLDFLSDDERLHTNFHQAALTTGRLSSQPNCQVFPRHGDYRACIKARPGYKMVGADYSQIEPRVIAQLSKDKTYMRVFWSEQPGTEGFNRWCPDVTEELDLYTEVGKEIGTIPAYYTKKDTKGPEAKPDGIEGRQQSKTANLGLGYGTGMPKFHLMCCLDTGVYHTRRHTDSLYKAYWDSMENVKSYLDSQSALTDPEKSRRKVKHPYSSKEVTYAESIMGRKRFFEPENPTWWTQGRNMPIQSTAGGDMLKKAAIELTHWAWKNDIDGGIINLIHDEFLAEVREDQAEEFAKAMQYCMEKVGAEMCPDVPIVAGVYIDDMWIKE